MQCVDKQCDSGTTFGHVLGLKVEQALEEGVVVGGLEPGRAAAVADVGVEGRRPHHEAEGVDLRQVDLHLLPAAPLAAPTALRPRHRAVVALARDGGSAAAPAAEEAPPDQGEGALGVVQDVRVHVQPGVAAVQGELVLGAAPALDRDLEDDHEFS